MSESSTPTRPMVMITRHGPGGHIAELSLDRPEAMNAVSTQMARSWAPPAPSSRPTRTFAWW